MKYLILQNPVAPCSAIRYSINAIARFLICMFIFLTGCNQKTVPELEGMVYIPSGEFLIGSDDKDTESLSKEFGARETFFENEEPARKIFLKGFYIDKFEVTNENYKSFISQTGYFPPPRWENGTYLTGRETHPVKNVSWFDANSYCKWAGKRLPTEEEWEKAARGPNGNIYPWGNEYNKEKANLTIGDTLPVGSMLEDKSFYGVYDMAGNLKEWTLSWYKNYPGSTLKSEFLGEKFKVIRGTAGNIVGHYNLPNIFSRASYRSFFFLNRKVEDIGFRCAKDKRE